MIAHGHNVRPEGPAINSPGRQAGVADRVASSAEGAALELSGAAPSALILSRYPIPGLTAGPTQCRPFGPE